MERITISADLLASASVRSFRSRNPLTAAFRDWYEGTDADPLGLVLNASEDASLKTALCRAAGMVQEKTPKLNPDGTQAVSEKRGKPIFLAKPFTSEEMVSAMDTLGVVQYDLGKITKDGDTCRKIALVKTSGETVSLADTGDDDDDDNDDN